MQYFHPSIDGIEVNKLYEQLDISDAVKAELIQLFYQAQIYRDRFSSRAEPNTP